MLAHLATGISILLLLISLVGLTLLAERLTRSYLLARAASPVFFCLVMFFVEHFVGLGSLSWLWPVTSAAAVILIWHNRRVLRSQWRTEAAFLTGFGYAFAWRFAFPDLNSHSEKLTDLGFILNYMNGTKLPPMDNWFPPYPFDIYYAFQHYCAALLGRILGMEAGVAYQFALCVLIGLTAVAAAGAVHQFFGSERWHAGLAVAVVLVGGNGASLFIPWIVDVPALSASMRLIGGSIGPEHARQPFTKWLLSTNYEAGPVPLEMSSENLSYLITVGDYHPVLAGFFLLALALLCIASVERGANARAASAVCAATIPLTIISNTWTLPLQAALIGMWLISRLVSRKHVDYVALAAGFAAALILAYPFLTHFAPRSLEYKTSLLPVPVGEHAPWPLVLFLFYPFFGVLVLQVLFGVRKRLAWGLLILWLGLAIFSETFYIEDPYTGRLNRFNTTLKWWPWVYTGALLTTGMLNLQSKSRTCRVGTLICIALATGYSLHLCYTWIHTPKPHLGRLDGAAWLRQDPEEHQLLEFLRQQPKTIVLQRVCNPDFTSEPGLVMHAGQTPFLGWPNHEKLWRNGRGDIETRRVQIEAFYHGDLADSERWLRQNGIRHVLWLRCENHLSDETFEKINAQISSSYVWSRFSSASESRVGIWSQLE